MAGWRKREGEEVPAALVSHTGVVLSRPATVKFAADPTVVLGHTFFSYAGARRFTINHHLARVKENLEARATELAAGFPKEEMTQPLSWSKVSFIQEFNDWKTGKLDSSLTNEDGSRGLSWRDQISADVFECASVDAATALANYKDSATGARQGVKVGFPRFKSRHHTTPSFRLRSRANPGETAPIRVTGPKTVRLPSIGEVRVQGCTRRLRRMVESGRFHIHSATVSYAKGKWWIAVNGMAAEFHHQRRTPAGRHQGSAGLDRGVKTLAVLADSDGQLLGVWEGVNALRSATRRLKMANQALARTKPGSNGPKKARARLTRIHARVGWLRADLAHKLSFELATTLTRLTIEDLNVAGMVRNRRLAKSISDAGLGELGRQLAYKARWYGLELHVADRWFASSKTCSGCGHVKAALELSERVYACEVCDLEIDRDRNAAVNLARWPASQATTAQTPQEDSPPLEAAA